MSSTVTNSGLQSMPAFSWLRHLFGHIRIRRRERALRIVETVSLGEKRLVAVLEFEEQQYLIGVTNQSITLLRSLRDAGPPARESARPEGMDHAGGQG
jgi:flagellar biogenesis protein FliO